METTSKLILQFLEGALALCEISAFSSGSGTLDGLGREIILMGVPWASHFSMGTGKMPFLSPWFLSNVLSTVMSSSAQIIRVANSRHVNQCRPPHNNVDYLHFFA